MNVDAFSRQKRRVRASELNTPKGRLIDVRETSRGRHRDEVRALVLVILSLVDARADPDPDPDRSVGRCSSVRETIDHSKFTGTPI